MTTTAIHLTLTKRLLARANEAAAAEGLTRPEYVRRAIVSAAERTEAMQARRERSKAKPGRGR